MMTRTIGFNVTDEEESQLKQRAEIILGRPANTQNEMVRAILGLPIRSRGKAIGKAGRKPGQKSNLPLREVSHQENSTSDSSNLSEEP